MAMRYGLLARAPRLVHALRVLYEIVCICFEAAHHLVLFRSSTLLCGAALRSSAASASAGVWPEAK
jgi:hypothetical protein